MAYEYIERFKGLGFGLFVHFGLYSVVGKGEWHRVTLSEDGKKEYEKLTERFDVKKGWATELVKTAKDAGCRYITVTARHHDGFSLYDAGRLSDFDAPHSAAGRDLIKEFVEACREGGVVPFFYHTLLDWHDPRYKSDFKAYTDYLIKSVELLCRNYGEIGGLWFDGMWDKPDADWREDELYGTIRKYQPEAMIINNTGLSKLGELGHKEIDSVTFERGAPRKVVNGDKPVAGEMCQVLNDHWGYAEDDLNYKSLKSLICDLLDCRVNDCNFLLNTGLMGDGGVQALDREILKKIGRFIEVNKGFIYGARPCGVKAEGADVLFDGVHYYAVIKDVQMSLDTNVSLKSGRRVVKIGADVKNAVWLDNGAEAKRDGDGFTVEPFEYGVSYIARVLQFDIGA